MHLASPRLGACALQITTECAHTSKLNQRTKELTAHSNALIYFFPSRPIKIRSFHRQVCQHLSLVKTRKNCDSTKETIDSGIKSIQTEIRSFSRTHNQPVSKPAELWSVVQLTSRPINIASNTSIACK